MKRNARRRLLSLLLALAMVLSLGTVPAFAADSQPEVCSHTTVNPLYANLPLPEGQGDGLQAESEQKAASLSDYVSIAEAEAQIRDYMVNRQESFTISVYAPEYSYSYADAIELVDEVLFPAAYSEELANGVTAGDYLRWSWSHSAYEWVYGRTYGSGYFSISFALTYYTTASQEQYVISQVDSLVDELNLWDYSTYQRYEKIYEYVTDHVNYDSYRLNRVSRGIGTTDDYLVFSAYAALYRGKAVCQGYACLYYALCRAVDLPVRIITSEDHAWNIVCMRGIWYNIDATWDGQYSTSYKDYFMKGSASFASDHPPEDEYLTDAFTSAYPISCDDYETVPADSLSMGRFHDVSPEEYYFDAVEYVAERGLFSGMTTVTFGPDVVMTRCMLVTVLWRLEGKPTGYADPGYTDVAADAYYAEAVAWAADAGITMGTSDVTFSPDDTLTREQLATFLYRYADSKGYNITAWNSLSGYTDTGSISDYAVSAFRWAVGAGIIQGMSEITLNPQNGAPRCQLAVMLYRFVNYYQM